MADYDKVIPPGQEGKVNTKLDGKKLYPGPFEKSFTVRTNDPANSQFVLVMQGTVKKAFEFSRELRWTGFVDDPLKFEFDVTNLIGTPVTVTSVRWADDARAKGLDQKIGLKLTTLEKGKKYRIKMWSKKPLTPDNFVANIVLTTNFPKIKEKTLPMAIIVQKDVDIYPERLYFGEMIIPPGATKAFDRTFNIVAARGDSLKILKAVPNRSDMTVTIQELQPGKSYRGTVWIRPESRLGQYAGSIKIYTNSPRNPEIILDIVGSIRVGESAEPVTKSKK